MPETNENEQVNAPLIPDSNTGNEQTSSAAAATAQEPTTSAEARHADQEAEIKVVQTLPNEYRFIQQRIPPKNSLLRYALPVLLLGFQVVFIILFAFFGQYTMSKPSDSVNEQEARKYPSREF